MNIIGIDPSLISTAIVINSHDNLFIYNYCREKDAHGTKSLSKWYKYAEELVIYRFVDYRNYNNYSDGEIIKLKDYDLITDNIITDILNSIDINDDTIIGIEGYNFDAKVGNIIDLVTFSTLLRKKLYDRVSKNIKILSPSTLKLEACKLTYEPIIEEIGGRNPRKKYIWKNKIGMPGGKFTKHDMFLSIVENDNMTDRWSKLCRTLKSDIMSMSKVPKPFEDVDDAIILLYFMKINVK
jgi:hypothetical protein